MKKVLLLLLFPMVCQGNDICVGPSATGDGSGSDWGNQKALASGTYIRGNTYYLADGTYSDGVTLDKTTALLSGTQLITFKKATPLHHGSSGSWNASTMGSGRAIFTAAVAFSIKWNGGATGNLGYFVFDGQSEVVGNGFKFQVPTILGSSTEAFAIRNENGNGFFVYNLVFQYLEIVGDGDGTLTPPWDEATSSRGFHIFEDGQTTQNISISHCRIAGLIDDVFLVGVDGLTFEYNTVEWAYAAGGGHPNLFWLRTDKNIIIRYNILRRYDVECFEVSGVNDNWQIYGNVVVGDLSGSNTPRFLETCNGQSGGCNQIACEAYCANGVATNILVFNNTIKNMHSSYNNGFNMRFGDTGQIKNNLFYNPQGNSPGGQLSHDYNWYFGTTAFGEPNGIATQTQCPFTAGCAPTNTDFHILGTISTLLPRNKGTNLGTTYGLDIEGNVRPLSPAPWDIGAYEYVNLIDAPQNLRFIP